MQSWIFFLAVKHEILFRVRKEKFSDPGTGLVHFFFNSFFLPISFNCMSATITKQKRVQCAQIQAEKG